MAAHNELGKIGEDLALSYLMDKGYVLRDRNWRYRHLEIDLVMSSEHTVVFVEVKTRSDEDLIAAVTAVNQQKVHRLLRAANVYIQLFHLDCDIRFDIVTVVGKAANDMKVTHFENAFEP